MAYIVQSCGGDGVYVEPDERRVATLAEARAIARKRLGVKALRPERRGELPDEDGLIAVECWCEQTAAQADREWVSKGFIAIFREAEGKD